MCRVGLSAGVHPQLLGIATVATSYRECQALRAQNAKTVPKKSRNSHEKVPKRDFFVTFFDFFGTFLALARDDLFETFLAFWARRAWHSL